MACCIKRLKTSKELSALAENSATTPVENFFPGTLYTPSRTGGGQGEINGPPSQTTTAVRRPVSVYCPSNTRSTTTYRTHGLSAASHARTPDAAHTPLEHGGRHGGCKPRRRRWPHRGAVGVAAHPAARRAVAAADADADRPARRKRGARHHHVHT